MKRTTLKHILYTGLTGLSMVLSTSMYANPFITQLSHDIKNTVESTNHLVKDFMSKAPTKEKHSQFITRFGGHVTQAIALRNRISTELNQHAPSSQMYQILTISHEIATELCRRLEEVYSIFVNHQHSGIDATNAVKLCTFLKPKLLDITSAASIARLESRMAALYTLVVNYDASLAPDIKVIMDKIQEAKKNIGDTQKEITAQLYVVVKRRLLNP